jgi:serine acetyltransferase
VKQAAFVGIGATIIQGITIGESAVVGAGAVVLEDVSPYTTVVGVPARVVKKSHVPASHTISKTLEPELEVPAISRPIRRRPMVPTSALH